MDKKHFMWQSDVWYKENSWQLKLEWANETQSVVGSVQIHAVHTISQGALQNTDTIPVKFPNILPKQIRIKDIVIHGVGKRAQFSRYITFEI